MSDAWSAANTRVRINGIEAFTAQMRGLPVSLQKKILRPILRESVKIVREDARAKVPVLASPVLGPSGYPKRLPATVRKAISVRTSKTENKDGNVGVFVNVRPLKGNIYRGRGASRTLVRKSQKGADNPRDPYYWRWLEFGTQRRTSVRGKTVKDHNGAKRWIPSGKGANRGSVRPYAFLQSAAGKLGAAIKDFERRMNAWVSETNSTGRIQ